MLWFFQLSYVVGTVSQSSFFGQQIKHFLQSAQTVTNSSTSLSWRIINSEPGGRLRMGPTSWPLTLCRFAAMMMMMMMVFDDDIWWSLMMYIMLRFATLRIWFLWWFIRLKKKYDRISIDSPRISRFLDCHLQKKIASSNFCRFAGRSGGCGWGGGGGAVESGFTYRFGCWSLVLSSKMK